MADPPDHKPPPDAPPEMVPADPPTAEGGWTELHARGDYDYTDMLALPGYGYLIRSTYTPHGQSQQPLMMAMVFVPEPPTPPEPDQQA